MEPWTKQDLFFTQTTSKGVDLYIIDLATLKAVKVNKQPLNVVLGKGTTWIDGTTLLYRVATKPASSIPVKPLMPKGPSIQESLGKAAPNPTYQDLIKTPFDEQLFEFLATSQLIQYKNGVQTPIGQPAIYTTIKVSPDKKYLLQETISKPFSYLVPFEGFPSTIKITDLAGKSIKVLATFHLLKADHLDMTTLKISPVTMTGETTKLQQLHGHNH
ncbi:hypothetical protein [Pedobacter sp. NJ-S-72]